MLEKLLTKSFFIRLMSSVLLVILTVITFLRGGMLLFVTILAVSLIGLFELYRVMNLEKKLLGVLGYVVVCFYYVMVYKQTYEYLLPLIIAFLMALMAVYVFTFPAYRAEQVFVAFFGFFYVAVLLSYVYQTRSLEEGVYLVWLVFLSSWICDSCAYLAGVMLGKHKLAPVLSPKKSVEGSIGGIIGSCVLGALYGFFFRNQLQNTFFNPVIGCALVCAAASVISQIGDLAASAIKRNHDVKDYGKLIPGHGGILDRFDSVIFVAPAIYYLCIYLN